MKRIYWREIQIFSRISLCWHMQIPHAFIWKLASEMHANYSILLEIWNGVMIRLWYLSFIKRFWSLNIIIEMKFPQEYWGERRRKGMKRFPRNRLMGLETPQTCLPKQTHSIHFAYIRKSTDRESISQWGKFLGEFLGTSTEFKTDDEGKENPRGLYKTAFFSIVCLLNGAFFCSQIPRKDIQKKLFRYAPRSSCIIHNIRCFGT